MKVTTCTHRYCRWGMYMYDALQVRPGTMDAEVQKQGCSINRKIC